MYRTSPRGKHKTNQVQLLAKHVRILTTLVKNLTARVQNLTSPMCACVSRCTASDTWITYPVLHCELSDPTRSSKHWSSQVMDRFEAIKAWKSANKSLRELIGRGT